MRRIIVGRVLRPRGIKGELKVEPLTHDPQRFADLQTLYYEDTETGTIEALTPVECKFFKGCVYLRFDGVDSKDKAEKLRNLYLEIPIEERLQLPPDHYYIYELEGLQVFTKEKRRLGILKEVMLLPANDVYRVVAGSKEYLIPATKEVVREVNLAEKTMLIDPIPGLLGDNDDAH